MPNIFNIGLDKNSANYTPLSPLSFLLSSAHAFPGYPAIIYGDICRSWAETAERCLRLASALTALGIGKGDTVSIMAPNIPEMLEAHFGVPWTGAVLNTLNIRLEPATLAYIINHAETKVILTDTEFSDTISQAIALCQNPPLVIDIIDPQSNSGSTIGSLDYEELVLSGAPDYSPEGPEDEWDAISLNYTSGTTGRPKGVVYHHRGAYLNAISNAIDWNMARYPKYLWTLPMFHCNGWCFPWTLAALAGTNVCLRHVSAKNIYHAIAQYKIEYFCGAPVVLNLILNSTDNEIREFQHPVKVMTAAAPPPPSVLAAMELAGFSMTHVYGLTETYGPAVINAWQPNWENLTKDEQAQLKSRQGIAYHSLDQLQVRNSETRNEVKNDSTELGEVIFRGNILMKGYLKDPVATKAAFDDGWFHSGDLGVTHPDGYIQLKDRAKDIIISGGENISSIEIEDVLYGHPAVLEAAVVAQPDAKWGERPCAFVQLKFMFSNTAEEEILTHCRGVLPHYKCPDKIILCELPKTSTGKIQKYKLRQIAAESSRD